jgi:hypothetical protein
VLFVDIQPTLPGPKAPFKKLPEPGARLAYLTAAVSPSSLAAASNKGAPSLDPTTSSNFCMNSVLTGSKVVTPLDSLVCVRDVISVDMLESLSLVANET